MKFGPIPLEQAEGKILGHNIAGPDGKRTLRKGNPLTAEDVQTLQQLGRHVVYVAELEANDVSENDAAHRIATAVSGNNIRLSQPATGRVNLYANCLGVLRVDAARLARINACNGVTLATLPTHTAVNGSPNRRKMVATVKILPFALPETIIRLTEAIAAEGNALIRLDALQPKRVVVILSGSPTAKERILKGFDAPLRTRLTSLGATLQQVEFIPLEDEQGEMELARTLHQHQQQGIDLIILAGETAIMDDEDIAPRAVVQAGGEVACFGAPVDPGNLLMLAYLNDVPILGAPGCVRSPKANVVDWILPRLLVGDRLTMIDLFTLGHGGLLEDVPERPMPRSRLR